MRSAVEPLESRTLLSTYMVNTISDAAAPGPGMLTLRQAIYNANSHSGPDTIAFSTTVFNAGILHTITLARGQLLLTDKSGATTIAGPGSAVLAISGGGASRVFNVATGVSATISGLAVTNGQAPVDSLGTARGGGIFNAGTLSLSAVNISHNSAAGAPTGNRIGQPYSYAYGGGIYSTGPLHLQNSTVTGNSALGGSGTETAPPYGYGHGFTGANAYGGGIWCGADLTISASNVSNNQATGGLSGFTRDDNGPDNGGSAFGGGIACSELTLTDSTVSGNTAQGRSLPYDSNIHHIGRGGSAYGGGISAGTGIVTITNSTLSGNQAIGSFYPGDDFGAFAGSAAGGALWGRSSAIIQSSTITLNQAIGGDNTAFGDGGNASGGGVECIDLSVTASTISKNTAAAGEGTAPADPASASGGGIECGGSLSLTQSTVTGNTATSGDVLGGGQGYPGGSAGGGAFVAGAATIVQSTVSGNTDSANFGPTPYPSVYSSVGVGGGLNVQGSLTLSSSTVSGNSVAGAAGEYDQGGGIWCGGSSLAVTNSTIANNSVSDRGFQDGSDAGPTIGGGIAATGNVKLYDSTIVGNTVGDTASGGGLSVTSPALLDNSIVSANKADGAFNDISGPVLKTSANNLIGVGGGLTNGVNGNKIGLTNPKLAALGNYGGPTQTMPPLIGSPAIDAGNNSLVPAGVVTDQRGFARIVGGKVDIGAVEFSKIVIAGAVYNDINGDGIRQAGEPGMANVQAYVDLTNAGVFIVGDPVATSDASGNYVLTFAPLTVKGSLIVREVRPPTMRRTQPAGIYPLGFYTISSTAGAVSNINFGNSLTSLITGTVYHDTNSNGKLDAGEAGLLQWNVHASYVVNNVHIVKTILTDNSGNYSFVLPAGSYTITETVQPGFTRTKPGAGGYTLTLAPGATITGENFGNV
ncbi:MAG TPA: choice-of-anchor Q domain-containing protein [Humisphaera sp.]|nr:choice-of-anchor Q domain-containing protein [Humisphaera sp.]